MSEQDKPSISVRAAKAAGRTALFVAKTTGKVGWAVAKPVGRQTGKFAARGGKAINDHASIKFAEYEPRKF